MYLDEIDYMNALYIKGFGNKLGFLSSANQFISKGSYSDGFIEMMKEGVDFIAKSYDEIDMKFAFEGSKLSPENFETVLRTKSFIPELVDTFYELYGRIRGRSKPDEECIYFSKKLGEIIKKIEDANFVDGVNFNDRRKLLERKLRAA